MTASRREHRFRQWTRDEEQFAALVGKYDLRFANDPSLPYPAESDSCGSGWLPLIEDLVQKLIALGWNREVVQVKTKFGALRFYVAEHTEEMEKLIAQAENRSASVCERCGKPGVLRSGPPAETLCDEHGAG